jgi:hypothetical protein
MTSELFPFFVVVQFIESFIRRRVVFVDTDAMESRESRVGDLVQNETEAALVQQVRFQ